MKRVSVSYAIKYELDFAPNYQWTECDKCINTKTSRIIRQVYCGRSIGYCIKGKFYSLTKLRNHLVKPKQAKVPF
jgi:hypothetical protein